MVTQITAGGGKSHLGVQCGFVLRRVLRALTQTRRRPPVCLKVFNEQRERAFV